MKKTISVFGLGYVGTVLLGCMARDGHNVIGVDIDAYKLKLLRDKKSPVLEEGMQDLIESVMNTDLVKVVDDTEYAILNSDISFICVGTPSLPNGSQDLTAIKRVAEKIGSALKNKSEFHVITVRSTVTPGTVEEVMKPIIEEKSFKKTGENFGLCFQPEFLREGTSIKDYDNPPFTIIGGDSKKSISIVCDLFKKLPCDIIETSIRNAEMVKYCCNVFHALKITFANEIGRICQSLSVNSHEVMDIVCQDTQLNISPAYMKPGFAFGGSCLPKDLKGLLYLSKTHDIQVPVISHIINSNIVHIEHAINTVLLMGKKSVLLVGLSFKSGTDDLRESPLVAIAERFIGKGLKLKIFDPHVNLSRLIGANRRYIETAIPHIASLMSDDYEKLIDEAEVIIVGQSHDLFIERLYLLCRKDQFVLDLVGKINKEKIAGEYQGVCW
ncbi:MAG: nucleotide sugar dehydrogenase [Proteobacteria bacterium]|nr:nucleotide sugar dehydrogenase [Pseudomonadota bacterium]MBU4259533.1 nucleotide sugar dehydrogenase [Pseudomonadota bacterium]MBU4288502.1 nucleotide sugar dehydrogenase [Pseudomonadota bacterium]MBU4413567.1 nucleotide sugar dehydrogenase [Pseudomonadota bacterium]MCG2758332.1 nucleotide sugar dehydrogenase [Desulfobacteraceae bacterium]